MAKEMLFRIEQITKYFGSKKALDITNLEIPRGQITALLGPNGAGKSTLLRILNFLEEPTTAKYTYRGIEYKRMADNKLNFQREMTMVFQKPFMFSTSVINNVMYGLKIRGVAARLRKQRAMEALEQVGLAHLATRNANTLSGGEAQRVALARSIAIKPTVLFLDEPTASLDPQSVLLIEKLVQDIRERENTTIILVTHNLFQARRIADEVAVLVNGDLIGMGSTQPMYDGEINRQAADFLNGEIIY